MSNSHSRLVFLGCALPRVLGQNVWESLLLFRKNSGVSTFGLSVDQKVGFGLRIRDFSGIKSIRDFEDPIWVRVSGSRLSRDPPRSKPLCQKIWPRGIRGSRYFPTACEFEQLGDLISFVISMQRSHRGGRVRGITGGISPQSTISGGLIRVRNP